MASRRYSRRSNGRIQSHHYSATTLQGVFPIYMLWVLSSHLPQYSWATAVCRKDEGGRRKADKCPIAVIHLGNA